MWMCLYVCVKEDYILKKVLGFFVSVDVVFNIKEKREKKGGRKRKKEGDFCCCLI